VGRAGGLTICIFRDVVNYSKPFKFLRKERSLQARFFPDDPRVMKKWTFLVVRIGVPVHLASKRPLLSHSAPQLHIAKHLSLHCSDSERLLALKSA
jgi:hypothetical protein